MPVDRSHSKTPFSILASLSLVTVLGSSPWIVYAQGGDVFSSDSGNGKTWWDVKRRDYPECNGPVDHPQMKQFYEANGMDWKSLYPDF